MPKRVLHVRESKCVDWCGRMSLSSEDVRNFALPIEKLGSPVERYQRVVMLYRRPNQISKNMLNRYFKLFLSLLILKS